MLVVPVVPEAATSLTPRRCAAAIEVPPVPAAGISFAAAATIVRSFVSLGSALMRMSPSISPAATWFAIDASISRAAVLTSDRVPFAISVGVPSTRLQRAAGVSGDT